MPFAIHRKLLIVDALAVGLVLGFLTIGSFSAVPVAAVLGLVRMIARLRSGVTSGWELFGVTFVVSAALLVGCRITGEEMNRALVYTLFAGVTAQAMWAEHRFADYEPPASTSTPLAMRVIAGVGLGALTGVFVSLVALLPVAAAVLEGEMRGGWMPILLIASYPVAGILVGAFTAVIIPLAKQPLGMVLLGLVGGAIAYSIFGAVGSALMDEPRTILERIGMAAFAGLLVGPPFAFIWHSGEGFYPVRLFP